jgi:hypothetical protein
MFITSNETIKYKITLYIYIYIYADADLRTMG